MRSTLLKNFLSLCFFSLFYFSLLHSSIAFQNRSIKVSELYNQILNASDTVLTFKDIEIVDDLPEDFDDSRDFIRDLEALLNREIKLSDGKINSSIKSIFFDNVSGTSLRLSNLDVHSISITDCQIDKLLLSDSNIADLFLSDNLISKEAKLEQVNLKLFTGLENSYGALYISDSMLEEFFSLVLPTITNSLYVTNSTFKEGAYLSANFTGLLKDILLENNVFEPIDSRRSLTLGDEKESALFLTQLSLDISGGLTQLIIQDNEFKADLKEQLIYVWGVIEYFDMSSNSIESSFFPNVVVNNEFNFTDNESLSYLVFDKFILKGTNNKIYWDQLEGFKLTGSIYEWEYGDASNEDLGMTYDDAGEYFAQNQALFYSLYRGVSEEELDEEEDFQNLISTYYRLYKVFKENGQIKDANQTYIEMKELESRELAHIYKQNGGLENYLIWRLNTLLMVYTEYGTNPARAIRISILVILAFSIFYFFYPSEWDTKSKKQLISDYKVFVEKNDQGYLKPLYRLIIGFGASLINAMTLSLNAFVTLGFGTIPTSGLARYVCILQGFLGWFLLSIFTASLINQILF